MEPSTKLWIIGVGVLVIVVAASIAIKKIRKNQRRSLPQYTEPSGYPPVDEDAEYQPRRRRVTTHDERPLRHERETGPDGRRLPRHHTVDNTDTPPNGFTVLSDEPGDYSRAPYNGGGFGYREDDYRPVEPTRTGFNTADHTSTRYTGDDDHRQSGHVDNSYIAPQQASQPEQPAGGGYDQSN